jgi:CHAT domain-containing protein
MNEPTNSLKEAVACILAARSPGEQWRCLVTYPEELTSLDENQLVDDFGSEAQTEPGSDLEGARHLLRRVQQEELLQVLLSLCPVPEKLRRQVDEYLDAYLKYLGQGERQIVYRADWQNVYSYLQTHEAALTDRAADIYMQDRLVAMRDDRVASAGLLLLRDLANVAREDGIEVAGLWLIARVSELRLSNAPPGTLGWLEDLTGYVQWVLRPETSGAIEQAIDFIERDLLPSIPANIITAHFEAHSGLGELYLSRLRGDRAENVIHALDFSSRALSEAESIGDSRKIGHAHYLIGWAHAVQISQGDRRLSLMRARDHLTEASAKLRESGQQNEWGQTLLILGYCFVELAGIEPSNDHKTFLLSEALRYLSEIETSSFSDTVKNSARVVAARAYTSYAEFDYSMRGQAFELIERALAECDRGNNPYNWALYRRLYAEMTLYAVASGEAADTALAKQYLIEATDAFATPFYAERTRSAELLGDLHLHTEDWNPALDAYDQAVKWDKQIASESFSVIGRESTTTSNYIIEVKAAYCLCRIGETGAAVLRAERAKGGPLIESFELEALASLDLPHGKREALQDAVRAVRSLEAEMRTLAQPASPLYESSLYTQLREARIKLEGLVAEVRSKLPGYSGAQLDAGDLMQLVPSRGVLVIPLISPVGTALVTLDNTSSIDSACVDYLRFTVDDLKFLLGEYALFVARLGDIPQIDEVPAPRRNNERETALSRLTAQLWESLGAAIDSAARRSLERGLPVENLVIISQLGLSALPLAAAAPGGSQNPPLLENFTVSVLPSASLFVRARSRPWQFEPAESELLAIADPTGNLPYAQVEVDFVARQFPPSHQNTLPGERATVNAVRRIASRRPQCFHFACHARFNLETPWTSGLVLADGIMTAAEIALANDLQQIGLVTLSACKSGVTFTKRAPEEYGGLSAAFVIAGARCVVSSLWVAHDIATAFLMVGFYQRLRNGEPTGLALRGTQLWLRSATAGELLACVESMLKEYPRVSPPKGGARSALLQLNGQLRKLDAAAKPFEHPLYWAAFYALDLDGLR